MYKSLQSAVKLNFYPSLFGLFDRMCPHSVCVFVCACNVSSTVPGREATGHLLSKQQMFSTVRQGIYVESKDLKRGHFVNKAILNGTRRTKVYVSLTNHMLSLLLALSLAHTHRH